MFVRCTSTNGTPTPTRRRGSRGCVAVRAGVDERAVGPPAQRVNRVDELALAVVLRALELDAELRAPRRQARRSMSASVVVPVECGLARAEQVEVRAVEDGDPHFCLSPSSQAVNCSMSSSAPLGRLAGRRGLLRGRPRPDVLVALPAARRTGRTRSPATNEGLREPSRNTLSRESSPRCAVASDCPRAASFRPRSRTPARAPTPPNPRSAARLDGRTARRWSRHGRSGCSRSRSALGATRRGGVRSAPTAAAARRGTSRLVVVGRPEVIARTAVPRRRRVRRAGGPRSREELAHRRSGRRRRRRQVGAKRRDLGRQAIVARGCVAAAAVDASASCVNPA